tara:strand:- start:259 stop:756 length:498 start_codon:yes stop_codon:yes gene_type:complete
MKIDKKSVVIGFLSCLCITMFFGFSQKDGQFDTIVANKIIIGTKVKPLVELNKDYLNGNTGLIKINNKRGFNGVMIGMNDGNGSLRINTYCQKNDPGCVASLVSVGGDEMGGLISIYGNGDDPNLNGSYPWLHLGIAENGAMIESYDNDSELKSYKKLVNKHSME